MLKLSARAAKVQSLHILILLLNKSKTKTIHSKQKISTSPKKITLNSDCAPTLVLM